MSGECDKCRQYVLDCNCNKNLNMTVGDHIKYFLRLFPKITKSEADAIKNILQWDGDKKAGFLLAKRSFEQDFDEYKEKSVRGVARTESKKRSSKKRL